MRSLAVVILLVGCSLSGLLSPDERRALNRAEARWNARPFADYTYEIRTSCFCAAEVNRWTRVSVRAGQVVAAEAVVPDPQFPITTLAYWQPIDSLFAVIRRSAGERGYLEDIEVTFDPVLGYPTHIGLTAKANIADGGATYSLREVRPLN